MKAKNKVQRRHCPGGQGVITLIELDVSLATHPSSSVMVSTSLSHMAMRLLEVTRKPRYSDNDMTEEAQWMSLWY